MSTCSSKSVNLALQGGGAHGAIVWGVIDCLLEDGRLGVEAISATSAGAMNGGYLGNPALYPLIYQKGSKDVIIVQVTAIKREELPASAADVLHRINEISFNSSLMREMRAVAFATKLIDAGELDGGKHPRMFMHWIGIV